MNKNKVVASNPYMTKARLRATEIKESNGIRITLESTITGWLMRSNTCTHPWGSRTISPHRTIQRSTRRAQSPVGTTTKEFKKLDFGMARCMEITTIPRVKCKKHGIKGLKPEWWFILPIILQKWDTEPHTVYPTIDNA